MARPVEEYLEVAKILREQAEGTKDRLEQLELEELAQKYENVALAYQGLSKYQQAAAPS